MISSQRIIIMALLIQATIAFAIASYGDIGGMTGTNPYYEQRIVIDNSTTNFTGNTPDVQSGTDYYQKSPGNQFKMGTAIWSWMTAMATPWDTPTQPTDNEILKQLAIFISTIRCLLYVLVAFEVYLIFINRKTS